jgi:hypothetical protein
LGKNFGLILATVEEDEDEDRFQKLLEAVGNVASYELEGQSIIPARGTSLFLPS